jgi:hypothetical protein
MKWLTLLSRNSIKKLSHAAIPLRSRCVGGGLDQVPVSVKEGLEYYHTVVWPSNGDKRTLALIGRLARVPFAETLRSYTALCRDPLKIALYFEKKIRFTRSWVAKYMAFLRLPIHDIFLLLADSSFKVIEYWGAGQVKFLCLSCPLMRCGGCRVQRPAVAKGGGGQGAGSGGGQGADSGGGQGAHSGGGQGAASGAAAVKKKKTLKVTLRVKRSNSGTFAVQKPDELFAGSAGKIHLLLKSFSTVPA